MKVKIKKTHKDELWEFYPLDNRYLISNYGRVWSTINNRELKNSINGSGYLCCLGESVHRLVAETFIPNVHNYTEVDHIDTNRKNNFVGNLKWCNHPENCKNPISINKRKLKDGFRVNLGVSFSDEHKKKISEAQIGNRGILVIQMSLDGDFIKEYVSLNQAAKQNNISRRNISRCCNGIYRQANGYKWIYKNK